MGEAKTRGSFHERKKSAIHKNLNCPLENFITPDNFKLSYSQESGFVQVSIVYLGSGFKQEIFLRADNREQLSLLMIQFGVAYMTVTNELFSLIAPDFHDSEFCS